MPAETIQTARRSRGARGDALRNATLLTGVTVACLLRALCVRRFPRPVLMGIGVVAAATVVALIHFGADVRAGVAGGQSGLLPSLVQVVSEERGQLAILRSERGDEA
jgi:hypothetical protein